MTVFYNEIDEYAAATLRNLIAAGHIAPGVVDTRSIEDIEPNELARYTQCHFFAGVGVWSLSLRQAGWSDDRPVWTGSCPCQPFSAAGKGTGFADERHLWPAWHHLVRACKPPVLFGEQVASGDAAPWLDLVQDDLEALGYTFGAVPFPSAGVGAPHIRDRLYWVADSDECAREQGRENVRRRLDGGHAQPRAGSGSSSVLGGLAHHHHQGLERGNAGTLGNERQAAERSGPARRLAHADGRDASAERQQRGGEQRQQSENGGAGELAHDDDPGLSRFAGLRLQRPDLHDADGRRVVGGFWADADWIPCRDNKWRPVEPGTFPLAHGIANRVGRLRASGNAINAEAARVFIQAYDESLVLMDLLS